jgi:hypothetical protein
MLTADVSDFFKVTGNGPELRFEGIWKEHKNEK